MKFILKNYEARKYILYKNGLLDAYKFSGKQGILEYIENVSVIQYDPVDVCGKSPELVLNSRMKSFSKNLLYELIYDDRILFDYYDKEMSILLMKDWKYFERTRNYYKTQNRAKEDISKLLEQTLKIIEEKGAATSKDLPDNYKLDWYWSVTSASRVALETLYLRGELAVSRKKNAIKAYDLAERVVPNEYFKEKDPYADDIEHYKWRVKRRIGALGLLWSKASHAFIGINGFTADIRRQVFGDLLKDGEIVQVEIEGINAEFFMLASDARLLEEALVADKLKPRCEFIAPLDNLIWDRKLTSALFGFNYKWEIYTPQDKRVYGYYTLPVLYGDKFIGRIELVRDRKNNVLLKKNFWPEDGVKITKTMENAMEKTILKLAKMNEVEYER